MNKKKLRRGYMSLVIISLSMIMMVFILNHTNKEKLIVNTVKGSYENMGDMSIVYTPSNSLFSNEEVIIDKNGLGQKNNINSPTYRDNIDLDKKHDKYFRWNSEYLMYNNESYIGLADFIYYNDGIDENTKYVQVTEKNIKSKEVKVIEVPIKSEHLDSSYKNVIFNTLYKDKLYMVVKQGNDENGKNTILIIEVDRKNESGKVLARYGFENNKDEKLQISEIVFRNKDKIFIESHKLSNNSDQFVVYDITDNKFVESNEFMNNSIDSEGESSKDTLDYNLQDNKLILLLMDEGNGDISKYDYKIDGYNLNLESKTKCNLKLKETNIIKKIRLIDDKIFVLSQSKADIDRRISNKKRFILRGVKDVNLIVFDINSNKVVYEADIINSDTNISDKLYIIKNK